MTIFKNSVPILSDINKITNSVILRYPETVAISDSKDVLMRVDFKGLGDVEFPEIPLMNSLSSFTSLLGLFGEERDIKFNAGEISVTEGTLTSNFITDNVALMDDFDQPVTHFERTRSVPDVAIFDLTAEDIAKINKASGVFKDLDDLVVSCVDGNVSVALGATTKFKASSNSFAQTYADKGTKDFTVAIPITNFKSIPVSDYTFMVKYNSEKDAYRILLDCTSLDGNLEILMTLKV